jgi:DNA repair exonuclease SbcCD ATPase subunit
MILEKMITDIVFRLALSELALVPKINMFVIDEELSYFNKSHLTTISKLINIIKKQYQYVIIISHDNKITDIADHEIFLNRKKNEYGFINNIDTNAKPSKTYKYKERIIPKIILEKEVITL